MKATFAMLALAVFTSAVHASGSNFPYSNCNSNNFDTSFFIESLKLVDSSGKTNDYLMTIGQAGCLGTSPCCNMDVHKVKFHIYEKCKHSIGKIVVTTNFGLDGKKTQEHSPTFQSYGPDMFTFKVSQLGWTKDTAFGSTILFQLKKDSACPDKTSFFVDDNIYSIGNEAMTCCPVWDFAALYNPSGTIYTTA